MRSSQWLDRGAVLFTGMAAGAVVAMSFQTDGHPFARILATSGLVASSVSATTTPSVPLLAAPLAPAVCVEHFPFSANVIGGLRANRPLRIGVFGDSFGDGVWLTATQYFHGKHDFAVYQFSHEATGFTRYQSLDLYKDAQTKLVQQPIDIALINFGANDTQGIWVDGGAAPYMSKPWQALIASRATALVGYLQGQGVAVGWVGLPRMRKPAFDGDIQAMNAFYAGLMCKLHVPFVNPVAASEDASHHFAKELIDPTTRTPYLARADDGIHMSPHGYRIIAGPLFDRIDVLSERDGTVFGPPSSAKAN